MALASFMRLSLTESRMEFLETNQLHRKYGVWAPFIGYEVEISPMAMIGCRKIYEKFRPRELMGSHEALALPTLKRVIRVKTLSQSAQALFPPHKCGGSHSSTTSPGTAASSHCLHGR